MMEISKYGRSPLQSVEYSHTHKQSLKGYAIRLRREGSDGQSSDLFIIEPSCKEGGSCVCYDAILVNENKRGKLKEYYPVLDTRFKLKRSEQNHVILEEGTWEEFQKERDGYVQAYNLIREKMLRNEKANLRHAIPPFSIYSPCNEQGVPIENATVYIWTEDQDVTVFSEVIESIHNSPNVQPEHKLFTVLQVIISLTECIGIFHENSLLHLDIKPQNFSIPKRKGTLLTDLVYLFDIDSMLPLEDAHKANKVTDGFSAPEVWKNQANTASDIYSIGCTLFCALTQPKRSNQGYFSERTPDFMQALNESALISATDTTNNIYLKHILVGILERCLAYSPRDRYSCCADLIKDLKSAIGFLYPARFNKDLPPHKQLVLLDKELDQSRGPGMHLSLLYHLYRHPLYDWVPHGSDSLHVMILGFGNYGQAFLDSCLQAGQMNGIHLCVTVISNDCLKDMDIYLSSRPAFASAKGRTGFFSVGENAVENDYASITFAVRDIPQKGSLKNVVSNIINEYGAAHYLFIALGDDQQNRKLANSFSRVLGLERCSVNFVTEKEDRRNNGIGNVVCMEQDITQESDYQELERMAFNSHLLWKNHLNIDMERARNEFLDRYYYRSSISNAIGIKYRLHDLGLSLEDPEETARQYLAEIRKDPNQRVMLMTMEHRRWNVEKICEGYTPITDLGFCLTGKTKDTVNKKHICLVRSRCETPLQDDPWKDPSKWDMATTEELMSLDELDRLSVQLHQTYMARANEVRNSSALFDDIIKKLESLSDKSRTTRVAFSEWITVISLLGNGARNSAEDYAHLTERLKETFAELPAHEQDEAVRLLETVDERFHLLLNSTARKDWKKIDERLVEGIPFILTYRTDLHLAIPFATGTNTDVFGNVAVPTVVNPRQVTYVYDVDDTGSTDSFFDAVNFVFGYFSEKDIQARVHFLLVYNEGKDTVARVEEVKKRLTEANERVARVLLLGYKEGSDREAIILKALCEELRVDAFEKNYTDLSRCLENRIVHAALPSYRYNFGQKIFYSIDRCEFLKYIRADQYLKAADMFASNNAKRIMSSLLTFHKDYERLWQFYRENTASWNRLCALLSRYHEDDTVASFCTDSTAGRHDMRIYRLLRSADCFTGANRLISYLVEVGVFDPRSCVSHYSFDCCEITVHAASSLEDTVNTLFEDPRLISNTKGFSYVKQPHRILVNYDQLTVHSLDLSAEGQDADSLRILLQKLESQFSFIYNLTESPDNRHIVSFRYSMKQVKNLLTSATGLLENYMYLKCLISGRFDDVTASYQVSAEDSSVTDQCDMVVTKGFAGLMVEVKAAEEITPQTISLLSNLAKQYGTNSKAVLIVDTAGADLSIPPDTEEVYTVLDSREIDDIDVTLDNLLTKWRETVATHYLPVPQILPRIGQERI